MAVLVFITFTNRFFFKIKWIFIFFESAQIFFDIIRQIITVFYQKYLNFYIATCKQVWYYLNNVKISEETYMFETKALIACDNERFVDVCSRTLVDFGINLLQCAADTPTIISSILINSPDFLIIDTSSSEVNPAETLRSINLSSMSKKPIMLVSVDEDDEFTIQELKNAGTFRAISSPMTISSLTTTLLDCSHLLATMAENLKIPSHHVETAVSEIIHNIGVPANIKGYHFLRSAIVMCINDAENLHSVTKNLYPSVAKMHNTTASRVERAIRHSIAVTWNRGNPDAIHMLLGFRPNNYPKPTNSEFIAIITDNLRVKMKLAV